jgi:hypothetical protein
MIKYSIVYSAAVKTAEENFLAYSSHANYYLHHFQRGDLKVIIFSCFQIKCK